MASYRFITLAILLIVLPAVAIAKEHLVGGDNGWTTEYDYAAWASKQVFYVGDTLVFKYTAPNHNVIKVNVTEFQECTPSKLETPLTSGYDVIPLATSGKKWYICGKVTDGKKHCELSQKLVINVMDSMAPAPTPKPSDAALSSPSPVIVVAAVVLLAMIMA